MARWGPPHSQEDCGGKKDSRIQTLSKLGQGLWLVGLRGAISRPEATHGSWAEPFQVSVRAEVPWAAAAETKSHSGLITNPLRLSLVLGGNENSRLLRSPAEPLMSL